MSLIKTCDLQKIMATNISIENVLDSIDIESIEDHTIKVICRTIKTSIEILKQHISEN